MYSIGGDATPIDCLYVSHQSGQDTPQCGSRTEPCQTLPQALLFVRDGGKICLDGRNSERHPYSCFFRGNVSREFGKSVAIFGLFAKAHITCDPRYGNLILRYPENRLFKLTLYNLVFHSYGVDLIYASYFNVSISSCRFINSSIAVGIVQKESRIQTKSSIVVTDSEFLHNKMSVYATLYKGLFTLRISRCVFQGRKGRFKGASGHKLTKAAVYIKYKEYPTNMVFTDGLISDCLFQDLGHEDNSFALSFRSYGYFVSGSGSLLISNCTFLCNENAISVVVGFYVQLRQVTINFTYGYALLGAGASKINARVPDVRLLLDHCILSNNKIGIRMDVSNCVNGSLWQCPPNSPILVVNNSLFVGGNLSRRDGDAIRFSVQTTFSSLTSRRPNFIKGVLILENVTFQGFHNSVLYVNIQKNVSGKIYVKNCKFLNNSEFVYRLVEQPTVKIVFDEEAPPECLKRNYNSKNLWDKKNQFPVVFENSIFENNFATSGALNFFNGNITFKNCSFKDNEGLTLGAHIKMKNGYGRLNIVNSNFLQTRLYEHFDTGPRRILNDGCFLYSESAGPVIIRNSSFTANISKKFYPILAVTRSSLLQVDSSSTIQCPSGKWLRMGINKENGFSKGSEECWMKINYVKIFCEECPPGFYTLQRGLTTGSLNNKKETKCLKCPYGAYCANGTIKAKENFWGLEDTSSSPPSLKFFHCPSEYCNRPRNSTHYGHNSCHGRRDGVLCGKCSDGYSEALYSTSCRKNDKCNNNWFWLATGIYVVVFAVYIVFKPPIFSGLLKQSLWFKNKPAESDFRQTSLKEGKKHDFGYLKIIFYFYQMAELVMIKSPEKTFHLVPIIPPIIAIFNFQVKSLNGSIGCPFPGLTAVTKELFKCMKFLGTLLSIGLIYVLHRATSRSLHTAPPSIKLYLAVALETLLLGYERLADTSLKLLHCVPIDKDWRLFVDGTIQCWQWWQFLLTAFIMSFIIPLVLVLFWGSLRLSKDKVTAKEFLIACAFPLPCLLFWMFREYRKDDQQMLNVGCVDDAKEIKQVLHGPFRAGSSEDQGTLYWEGVLTGRRLILLVIHTFATDPTIRFVCLSCTCVIILVHHLTVRPFCERKANICEGFSLLSLFVICMFSLTEATLISHGIDPTGQSKDLFHAVQWIEIGLLSLAPLALCLLVAFCALSQVARLLYHFITCLSHVKKSKRCTQESLTTRPFVVDWDSEEIQVLA